MLSILCLGLNKVKAQSEGIEYKIIGTDLFCSIDKSLPAATIDSVLGTCGIKLEDLEGMLWDGNASPDDWVVSALEPSRIVLKKPLHSLKGKPGDQKELMQLLSDEKAAKVPNVAFGYNEFHLPAITELENGLSRFFIKVEGSPQTVFISGTFNNWSTSSHPMEPCDSGYFIDLRLEAGAHLYKYIVNGYWFLDPRNKVRRHDWEGNENSVYYKPNHVFRLRNFTEASWVNLAASFNGWNEANFSLARTPWGWERECYVQEGTHAYKFIVDGEWITDPDNEVIRSDGDGHQNSFMAVGDTFYFYFPRNRDAKKVVVSGNFNLWNPDELEMLATDSGWVLPYVLAAGNYEYRFRVEGIADWQLDPMNPLTIGPYENRNSALVVGANHHFFFPAKKGLEEVRVAGDFNGWNEWGLKMERRKDGWHADVYLPKGKTRYKFIVDGEWEKDPKNPLFEPNEYGGFNSIVWRQ